MRKTYLAKGDVYDPTSIRVRSTDFNRTLMSVSSQLQGLFSTPNGPTVPEVEESMMLPPGGTIEDVLKGQKYALPDGMTVVPVHTLAAGEDTLLRAYSAKVCPVNSLYQ